MRLSAGVLYKLYRPSTCELRVYLWGHGVKEAEPGPYEKVIERLGIFHEGRHLESLGEFVNLEGGTEEERVARTIDAVKSQATVIYQGTLKRELNVGGKTVTLIGQPDFLLRSGEGYLIRDAKLSRRITDKDHPEILGQVRLYGLLFEKTFGRKPVRLEVFAGSGELVEVPYVAEQALIETLSEIAALLDLTEAPFSPVGWTKCGACGYRNNCWDTAVKAGDVALVPLVDQGMTKALRTVGVATVRQLLEQFNESSLAEFKRPRGKSERKVGALSPKILTLARALDSGKQELLAKPEIPDSKNYVMFDLEGLPPQLDELDKIYLWGFQVFGEHPGPFEGVLAGMGTNGDREGWEIFLRRVGTLFDSYGDIPFVHWHHYEKTYLSRYSERYGDSDGIAERVKANLLDLLPVTQRAVALPIPSYSLKVVEKYVGFERTQDEYGGDWAMAKFIEATETEDSNTRKDIMEQILKYNEEDLQATWAVFQWVRNLEC